MRQRKEQISQRIDARKQAVRETLPSKDGGIDAGSLQEGEGQGSGGQIGHRLQLSHAA